MQKWALSMTALILVNLHKEKGDFKNNLFMDIIYK
jgi:hypothetical protein